MSKLISILNKACGDNSWITVCGTDYDTLVMQNGFTKPSKEVWDAAIEEVEAEYLSRAYITSREKEYPSFTDYLDGIVKGDQSQIDAYITACQAVKLKYPKP
jgi:hypothetical protein